MDNTDDDIQMEKKEYKGRVIPLSLINKSCIQRVSMMRKGIKELPIVRSITQELNLSDNLLQSIPLNFPHLKILIVDHNHINRIPEQINQITTLRHLSANHNQVTLLPFLKHITHLQLAHNPIKIITSQLKKMKLQHLSFDWFSFLFCSHFNQSIHNKGLQLLIEVLDEVQQKTYVQFHTLYELISMQKIQDATYRAISQKYDFFIEYLRDYRHEMNFNSMMFMDKLLLEYALKEQYEKGLQIFMLRRSHLQEKEIFYLNLELACKYGHQKMFQFVYGAGMKRINLWQKDAELARILIDNFSLHGESSDMLCKILKYSKRDSNNKIVYRIPKYYSAEQATNIGDAITFIIGNPQLSVIFDFNENSAELEEPVLHFSMANKHVKLLINCLEHGMNPFQKNKDGKIASNIRGSSLCRKILKKYEKCYMIKKMSCQNSIPQKQNKNVWLDFIFGSSPAFRVLKSNKAKHFQESVLLGYVLHCESKNISSTQKLYSLNCRNSTSLKKYMIQRITAGEDKTGVTQDFILNSSSFKKIEFGEEKSLRKTLVSQQIPLLSYQIFQQNILPIRELQEHKSFKQKIPLQKSSKIPVRLCTQICNNNEEENQNTKYYSRQF